MTDFHGEPTRVLQNEFVTLEHLVDAARIVRFAPKGKPNLFADLGLSPLHTPHGDLRLRGGHRLWHAPEAMPRTYMPDNEGAVVTDAEQAVQIEMPAEPWTGIAKTVQIELAGDGPQVTIRHRLRNEGAWPVELAPWAITMLRLGGIGIFPQPSEAVDQAALLPNRHFSLWPYALSQDPRFTLRDDFVIVDGSPRLPPLKFGYFNPFAWMGYWIDGILFVKRFEVLEGGRFPDGGCNSECYCNDQFIELESLGPLGRIEPGKEVEHTEIWDLYDDLDTSLVTTEARTYIDGVLQARGPHPHKA
jgi:hypothetical protein